MITTDLSKLVINKLTKAQYNAAKAAGNINENELYMTPDDSISCPEVTSADSGKILMVNDSGEWEATAITNAEGVAY